jgi:hypothetical protein
MISKKILAVAIAAAMASACSAPEGYQFGDGTRAALEAARQVNALHAEYCSTPNGPSRELLLAAIRKADPGYVGVCVVETP